MAIADILSTIKGFVSSSTKTHNEFKNESNKNNKNISTALRDISRMFTTQKSVNEKTDSSITEILDVTQSTSKATEQNSELLRQSISLQNQMLQQLKQINTGITGLVEGAGAQRDQSGGIIAQSLAAAAGILGAGVIAAPGAVNNNLLNNFFGMPLNGQAQGSGATTLSGSVQIPDMVKIAKEAGFNDQEAKIMAAIGAAESSGVIHAHNTRGEDSYGLWQINMDSDKDGGARRRRLFGISSNEELFDPAVNARAAYILYKQRGNFNDWSTFTNNAYQQYLPQAQRVETTASIPKTESIGGPPAEEALPYGDAWNRNIQDYRSQVQAGSPVMGGGNVFERQSQLAAIRKGALSSELRMVLQRAAAEAGVDVVVYSGGQPSKESGQGPRTGSTRHDNGNAADVYLEKDGKILKDPEDQALMAKFISAAASAGATGIGFGGEGKYMGAHGIHIGFGRNATWGGSPWVASAAQGVYNNQDPILSGGSLSASSGAGGLGEAMSGALNAAFELLGMGGGLNWGNLASSFFGIPFVGAEGKTDEKGNTTYDSFANEEQEGTDSVNTEFQKTPDDIRKSFMEKEYNRDRTQKLPYGENDFVNQEQMYQQDSVADQIKEVALTMSSSPLIIQPQPVMGPRPEKEMMTDFGAAGAQPLNTIAQWSPSRAILYPDKGYPDKFRWASRFSTYA